MRLHNTGRNNNNVSLFVPTASAYIAATHYLKLEQIFNTSNQGSLQRIQHRYFIKDVYQSDECGMKLVVCLNPFSNLKLRCWYAETCLVAKWRLAQSVVQRLDFYYSFSYHNH